ncbi:hypothetical protein FBY04_10411 [Pseudomonas sp. SJZ080]|nr:hypothetical protein FBY04_10411 [Pseudomonas sp. SJZ080]
MLAIAAGQFAYPAQTYRHRQQAGSYRDRGQPLGCEACTIPVRNGSSVLLEAAREELLQTLGLRIDQHFTRVAAFFDDTFV